MRKNLNNLPKSKKRLFISKEESKFSFFCTRANFRILDILNFQTEYGKIALRINTNIHVI